jgi:hypothetical protein
MNNSVGVSLHLGDEQTGARVLWAETLPNHSEPTVSVIFAEVVIFFHRSGQIDQLRTVLAEAADKMRALEQAGGMPAPHGEAELDRGTLEEQADNRRGDEPEATDAS